MSFICGGITRRLTKEKKNEEGKQKKETESRRRAVMAFESRVREIINRTSIYTTIRE